MRVKGIRARCCRCEQRQMFDRGRAFDGRRAYRCQGCGNVHTKGHKGKRRYSVQRMGHQFHDTGADRLS